jgi:Cu/Zn superoxide dismutase
MRNLRVILGCLVATGIVVGPFGTAFADRLPGSDHGGLPESATLLGANQVPAVTTAGSGTGQVTINPGHDELCFHITVSNLTGPPLAAHIHKGSAGTNGGIVVPFVPAVTTFSPPDSVSATAQGCVTVADPLLNEIRSDPAGFYINVHTALHPGGEVRGQLTMGQ